MFDFTFLKSVRVVIEGLSGCSLVAMGLQDNAQELLELLVVVFFAHFFISFLFFSLFLFSFLSFLY